jgi:integrase
MAGQIIDRGPRTWLVRVYLGKIGGKRRYVSQTVRGAKRDAQQVLTKMLRDRDQGTLAAPTRVTFADFIAEWQDTSLRNRVSARTFRGYDYSLRHYILPTLGDMRLTAIQPWDIQRLYQDMLSRGLSASTVRGAHSVIRSALKQAVRWRIIAANPAESVDLPRPTPGKHQALTPDQVRAFLKATADSYWRALYHVLVVCGLRPGEAFGLSWVDVDLPTGRLAVRQAVTYDLDRNVVLSEPKTRGSRRSIAIPPELVQVLSEHMTATRDIDNPLGLVFPNVDGTLIHPNHWSRRDFRRICRIAGAPPGFRLYDLRHTCATLALKAGIHPKIVSERLGHASTRLTLDTYSHVMPTMQDVATQQIASIVYGTGNHPPRISN